MISFCTTIKNRSRFRVEGHELLLFPNCVRSLQQATSSHLPCELIVTDWESDDWPLSEWLAELAAPVSSTVITAQGGFSRGRGLNLAAEAAKGDTLFFLDVDVVVCPELIDRIVQYATENCAFFPILFAFDDANHQAGRWIDAGYGQCAVKKEIFDRSPGWPEFNKWGGEDDKFFADMKGLVPTIRERVPGFFHQWHPDDLAWKNRYSETYPYLLEHMQKVDAVRRQLERHIPEGSTYILVDESGLGDDFTKGRRARPFLEKNGEYAGPPPDDATAVRELTRMRSDGASFVAIPWIGFWWLEHYSALHEYLRTQGREVFADENLVLFDLRIGA